MHMQDYIINVTATLITKVVTVIILLCNCSHTDTTLIFISILAIESIPFTINYASRVTQWDAVSIILYRSPVTATAFQRMNISVQIFLGWVRDVYVYGKRWRTGGFLWFVESVSPWSNVAVSLWEKEREWEKSKRLLRKEKAETDNERGDYEIVDVVISKEHHRYFPRGSFSPEREFLYGFSITSARERGARCIDYNRNEKVSLLMSAQGYASLG